MTSPRGGRSERRRSERWSPAGWAIVSLVSAVSFAAVVYLASTAVPFLVGAPSTDPYLGALNQCILEQLPTRRVGFAVARGAAMVAAYSDDAVVVCAAPRLIPGTSPQGPTLRRVPLRGVTAAAFDFQDALWLAAPRGGGATPVLWSLPATANAPVLVGEFSPVALSGVETGVVALDRDGRLVAVRASGEVAAYVQLDAAAARAATLAGSADGALVAVVTGGAVLVFEAARLVRRLAQGPCEIEAVWWAPEPDRLLLGCGPGLGWGLKLSISDGAQELLPRATRVRSVLVPGTRLYVQACDGLPCSAPSPSPSP